MLRILMTTHIRSFMKPHKLFKNHIKSIETIEKLDENYKNTTKKP
jgi:hypothetical protein